MCSYDNFAGDGEVFKNKGGEIREERSDGVESQ